MLPQNYDAVLARLVANVQATARSIERERCEAGPLVEELLSLPEGQQTLLVGNHRRYHSWAVSQELQDASFRAGLENPRLAIHLARLAVRVAEKVDVSPASDRLRIDLEVSAQAQLGNALRLGGQFVEAESAFLRAHELLRNGTGDPLVEGKMLVLHGSLRNEQSRYAEGLAYAKRGLLLFEKVHDRHLQGRALITIANACGFDGKVEEGLKALRRARGLLDAQREPRLAWLVIHNAVTFLVEAERYSEAEEYFAEDLAVAEEIGVSSLDRLRLSWLGGRIALGLGRHEEAEPGMRAVVAGFVERGYTMEAATAALELAVSLAERRRWAEVRELAGMLVPVFSSQEVEPEALAALAVFRDAALAETVEVAVVREILTFLHRVDRDPTARFRQAPPA